MEEEEEKTGASRRKRDSSADSAQFPRALVPLQKFTARAKGNIEIYHNIIGITSEAHLANRPENQENSRAMSRGSST